MVARLRRHDEDFPRLALNLFRPIQAGPVDKSGLIAVVLLACRRRFGMPSGQLDGFPSENSFA
jgi:hypothetical protein